jgi:multisubunit Na+/H+ antiporter MnhG subunit
MIILAFFIAIFGALLLLMCAIVYLKAKDVFTQAHIVMIANFYAVPLLLIGIEIERFSVISLIKIMALIILNLVVVNLLCHLIVRRAMINKIKPEAEFKKVD